MALSMSTYFAGSCACAAISSLSTQTDAYDAMYTFCKQNLGIKGSASKYGGIVRSYSKLPANIAFVAGPEIPGKGHSSRTGWWKYGTEFAAFIEENKLGKVATPGPIINHAYHPDTTCQVWIWQPDQAAVEAWWDANYGKETEIKKAKRAALLKKKEDGFAKKMRPAVSPEDAVIKFHTCPICGYEAFRHSPKLWKCPYSLGTTWPETDVDYQIYMEDRG